MNTLNRLHVTAGLSSLMFLLAACSVELPTGKGAGALFGSGKACSVDQDCPSAEECEDRICKLHGGNDGTTDNGAGGDDGVGGSTSGAIACSVDSDCAAAEECEHGYCAPDSEGPEDEHPEGTECVADGDCATGEECEHGSCVADDEAPEDENEGPEEQQV